MQPPESPYFISAEPRIPEFELERRFVANETELAHQELAKLKHHHGLLAAIVPVVTGEPREANWKAYLRDLEHYGERVNKHEAEIAGGLMPVKFFVINDSDEADEHIKVRIRVENGSVHPAKEAPARPARVDHGPVHVPAEAPSTPSAAAVVRGAVGAGFKRSGVKIGSHSIEAELSHLDAQDSADVIHQVLYIKGSPETRVMYEITSKHYPKPQRGGVVFSE